MLSFDFARKTMETIGIDQEGVAFFLVLADNVAKNKALLPILEQLRQGFDEMEQSPDRAEALYALCDELAKKSGHDSKEASALAFLWALDILHDKFVKRGISDTVFYETVKDFCYKLKECRIMHGVNGTFVRDWLFGFYKVKRFALGRLQYETAIWRGEPVMVDGYTVYTGDTYLNMHIPNSGMPFDRTARQQSYQMALDFFGDKLPGDRVVFGCTSWLLDPMFGREMPQSNIADFARDFLVVMGQKAESFNNAWRVYGRECELPLEQLPEDTTLRRVCKKRLLAGEQFYRGKGVFFLKK